MDKFSAAAIQSHPRSRARRKTRENICPWLRSAVWGSKIMSTY